MNLPRGMAWALGGLLVGSLLGGAAVAAPQPLQLTDLARIVKLSEATISPDGRWIAVIVATPDWKTDKPLQEIDLVAVADGARRAVTWKRTSLGSPRWSADGTRLAFLAEDASPVTAPGDNGGDAAEAGEKAGSKERQIFIMPMNGGDPMRVTEAKHGVESFAWSPDGSQIAFITADDPVNAQAIKDHDDAFKVTDNDFLRRAALTPWHLWVVPSAGGSAKRLTQGTFSLATDQQDSPPSPVWDGAGRRITVTKYPGPYWGPSFHSIIAEVDSVGGEPRTVVATEGATRPAFAPGKDVLAYLRPRGGDQNNGNAVYVASLGEAVTGATHPGGATRDADRDITRALARDFDHFAWLPGGKSLLLEGTEGTRVALWEQPLQGAARKLDLGEVDASPDLSVAKSGAIAFVGSSTAHPGELYVMDSTRVKPRRLTHVNGFIDTLAVARTETIEWRGPGDFREDGVLTYPIGFQPGPRYPLVLVIHGGPTASSTEKFSVLPQLLAAAGFLVFQPNYRGSNNLGDAYQHAIFRDTGEGPGEDVMAGVAAVEKLGIVDQARIGVSGWSYGGYMTAWLTGHYPIWKAAVAGAALTDWVMDYTVAYYQEGDVYLFGGSPWKAEHRDIWRQQSPITYAENVRAPTLILGDVGDPNVPLLNSYEWFHALRDTGVDTEFYAYPADTHFPGDIVRSTDVYRRWVAWMVDRLK